MINRYADVASRWHDLNATAWDRCKFKTLAVIVREAMTHTKGTLAACETVAVLCNRAAGGETVSIDQWREAQRAEAAAEAEAVDRMTDKILDIIAAEIEAVS
jgi:hypothetical protein